MACRVQCEGALVRCAIQIRCFAALPPSVRVSVEDRCDEAGGLVKLLVIGLVFGEISGRRGPVEEARLRNSGVGGRRDARRRPRRWISPHEATSGTVRGPEIVASVYGGAAGGEEGCTLNSAVSHGNVPRSRNARTRNTSYNISKHLSLSRLPTTDCMPQCPALDMASFKCRDERSC